MEASTHKGKIRKGATSNENVGSGFKSPFKLLSPIVHTKTIYLHDWWLMRPERGDGVAVGGFTIRREGVETSFCSASIKERHDCSTLESSDGFTIFISGLINKSVTEQNGFPPQICSHFLIGFPCNWDDIVTQHARKESTHADQMGSPDGSHTFPQGSFQEMTFLQKRDFLLSTHGLYEEDAISEHVSSDRLEKLQPAVTSYKVDITHDLDLPRAGKSKELHEKGKYECPILNLNGVRTRRMTKMEDAAKVKKKTRGACVINGQASRDSSNDSSAG